MLARWTSPDSIVPNPGNPQALNRHTYVYNSPLKYMDPGGHEPADWLSFGSGMATQFIRDMVFWVSPDVWTTMDALAVVVSQEAPPATYYAGQQVGRNMSQAVGTAMLIHGGANVVAGLGAMTFTGSGGAACAVATGGVCAIPAGALLAGEGALVGVGVLEAGYGGLVLAATARDPVHHMATNKNYAREPKWSRSFERLFARGGMTLDDAANEIPLPGHEQLSPHSQGYHQWVYDRLARAINGLHSREVIRAALEAELQSIGDDLLSNPGLLRQ